MKAATARRKVVLLYCQFGEFRVQMTWAISDLEAGLWYFYYFLTERGRAGLTENRYAGGSEPLRR